MRKLFSLLLIFLFSPAVFSASVTHWQIIPAESNITFMATQNGAPVTGKFKNFTGDVYFDPAELSASHVQINVDIASVSAAYVEVVNALKSADWFDAAAFPQAVFKADHFKKVGDNKFIANGTLKIRDKTIPVTLNFNLNIYTKTKAAATGSTVLKRTQFGLGKGDWAKTDAIKDNVNVAFTLSVVPAK